MIDIDEMIKSVKCDKVYIQTHNFPDADAFASAYGLQYLLAMKGVKSRIVYKGRVDHGSACTLVKNLNIDVCEYADISDMNEECEIFLVDAQKGNANIIDMPGDEVVCFDHHPTFCEAGYRYSDIRPDVGACASIIAQYIFKNDLIMPENIATALLYGIMIDTANLTRGVSQLDLDMFYRLYNIADHKIISMLDNSVLRHEDLYAYVNAINSIKVYGNTCYANTGFDCQEFLIASISDFMMKIENVDSAVVYSLKKDGIKISARSIGTLNMGVIISKALGGIGRGGGHENMAGGFVPYKDSIDPQKNEKYIAELINEIEQRFANEITKEMESR